MLSQAPLGGGGGTLGGGLGGGGLGGGNGGALGGLAGGGGGDRMRHTLAKCVASLTSLVQHVRTPATAMPTLVSTGKPPATSDTQ